MGRNRPRAPEPLDRAAGQIGRPKTSVDPINDPKKNVDIKHVCVLPSAAVAAARRRLWVSSVEASVITAVRCVPSVLLRFHLLPTTTWLLVLLL